MQDIDFYTVIIYFIIVEIRFASRPLFMLYYEPRKALTAGSEYENKMV